MADPGFAREAAIPNRGRYRLLFGQISPKNYMKMKKIGQSWEGRI